MVLDGLESLVAKNLVRRDKLPGSTRFDMLQTIHEYAREQLAAADEQDEVERLHAEHLAASVAAAEPALRGGADQTARLDRLELEHENVRAALRWALATGAAGLGLRIGGVMWRFWWLRGYAAEGRRRMEELLALPGTADHPTERAAVLNGAGALAGHLGDGEAARDYLEDSLALRCMLGDRAGMASSLSNLGLEAWLRGQSALARTYFEESLKIRRELGDDRGVATCLGHLANSAWLNGELDEAAELHEAALATFRRLESHWEIASSLENLGFIAVDQGCPDDAGRRFVESLAIWQQQGYARGLALLLAGFAAIAALEGDAEGALRLAGASRQQCQRLGAPLPAAEQRALNRCLARARAALGPAVAEAAWAAGYAAGADALVMLPAG
jgi:tetratricopeptide (TPR) repeat protein